MAGTLGGSKKQREEAYAIIDPDSKEVVVATDQIKRVSLAHCVRVLQNKPVEPEAETWVKVESEMHEANRKDNTDHETNIDEDDFNLVMKKFKSKNKNAYNFPTKAKEAFQKSIYKLCRRLIQDEEFPKKFSDTLLKQLWKRKGKREVLANQRYLHLKEWKPRLTETLLTVMMKDKKLEAGTKFKIGVPGHRIEEHLIVL